MHKAAAHDDDCIGGPYPPSSRVTSEKSPRYHDVSKCDAQHSLGAISLSNEITHPARSALVTIEPRHTPSVASGDPAVWFLPVSPAQIGHPCTLIGPNIRVCSHPRSRSRFQTAAGGQGSQSATRSSFRRLAEGGLLNASHGNPIADFWCRVTQPMPQSPQSHRATTARGVAGKSSTWFGGVDAFPGLGLESCPRAAAAVAAAAAWNSSEAHLRHT